jgi:hypothetical protein
MDSKQQQFIDDMYRYRGIEFARLGMLVEVDGDVGTIVGFNGSANLDVQFFDTRKFGIRPSSCHPCRNIKYFGADGALLAQHGECLWVLRPDK